MFVLVIFLTAVTLSGGNNLREKGVPHDGKGLAVGAGQPMATGAQSTLFMDLNAENRTRSEATGLTA